VAAVHHLSDLVQVRVDLLGQLIEVPPLLAEFGRTVGGSQQIAVLPLHVVDDAFSVETSVQRRHRQSSWATRHNGNGIKCVDGVAMLVEGRPFDPSNALGLCPRGREFDHFTFEVKPIAGAHRGEPP
jgi:hypothetical protein